MCDSASSDWPITPPHPARQKIRFDRHCATLTNPIGSDVRGTPLPDIEKRSSNLCGSQRATVMLPICCKMLKVVARTKSRNRHGLIPSLDQLLGFQSSCLCAETQFGTSPQFFQLPPFRSASLLPGPRNFHVHSLRSTLLSGTEARKTWRGSICLPSLSLIQTLSEARAGGF